MWGFQGPVNRALVIIAQLNTEEFKLPVEVGTFQPGPFCHPGHIGVFLIDELFKINFLEYITGFP
jgi:hypothetical protein